MRQSNKLGRPLTAHDAGDKEDSPYTVHRKAGTTGKMWTRDNWEKVKKTDDMWNALKWVEPTTEELQMKQNAQVAALA